MGVNTFAWEGLLHGSMKESWCGIKGWHLRRYREGWSNGPGCHRTSVPRTKRSLLTRGAAFYFNIKRNPLMHKLAATVWQIHANIAATIVNVLPHVCVLRQGTWEKVLTPSPTRTVWQDHSSTCVLLYIDVQWRLINRFILGYMTAGFTTRPSMSWTARPYMTSLFQLQL